MRILKFIFTVTKQNPYLTIIVILGFVLRIIGTNPGYYMHGYEIMYGQAVSMILNKTIGLEGNALPYPPLVAWIMAISFLFFFIPFSIIGYFLTHFPSQGLDVFAQWNQIFVKEILGIRYWQNAMYWGRYLTAFIGGASILLTYKVVIEFFSKKSVAIIAALMVALNYRLVLNSHMGFIDMYNVFFTLLVLYSLDKLLKHQTFRAYMFSSVCAGLLFLIKYQPYGFVALAVAHTMISARKSQGKRKLFLKNLFGKEIITSVLAALLIILTCHINYFLRWDEVQKFSRVTWGSYELGKFRLYIFPYYYIYHTGLGEILSGFALGGIITGLVKKKYRQSSVIILSVILTSFFLTTFYSSAGYYTYNLLVPISLLLIFSAFFWVHLLDWLSKRSLRKINLKLTAVICFFILGLALKDQIANSLITVQILSQPSNYLLAQQWLDENVKGPAVFGTYSNVAPHKGSIKVVQFPNLEEVFGAQEFLEEKMDYALVDFYQIHERLYWWMVLPPRIPIQFWNRPGNLLSQTYFVLAARELLWTSTLQAFLPQWQAFGYSYAVVKPTLTNFSDVVSLKKFNFDGKTDWTPLVYLLDDRNKLAWEEQGKEDQGSLSIKAGKHPGENYWKIMPGSIRWESPEMKIKGSFGYKVVGWIKSSETIDKKYRNGFIRLDFYDEISKQSVQSRPIISFVTSRIYGDSQWTKVEINAIAPEGANYARVGFQADNPVADFYLDNVEFSETNNKPKLDNLKRYTIPDEDFFIRSDSSFI